jgi:hypothetical protein
LTPGHPVGIGNPVVSEALLQVSGLADIKHPVCRVPHQIYTRPFRSFSEKRPAQPFVQRSRIGNEKQLAHVTAILAQTAAQFHLQFSALLSGGASHLCRDLLSSEQRLDYFAVFHVEPRGGLDKGEMRPLSGLTSEA